MAVDTAKRLRGPALVTNAAVTIYTTPANTTCIVKSILVNNTTGVAATLTMSIGADAAATEIMTAVSFAPNSLTVIPLWLVLAAAEIVQVLSGTNNALNVTLNGVESI